MPLPPILFFFFFFNDTATTEIYTLSLHDALPRNTRGERPHSSADFNTWPYLRFWFQKNGRRYQRYCHHGFSAILMRAPVPGAVAPLGGSVSQARGPRDGSDATQAYIRKPGAN